MKWRKKIVELTRLHVAMPKPRDNKVREPCIPESVLQKKQAEAKKVERKRKLEREIEEEMGDDYVLDLKKNYDIEGDQKFDIIPEFLDGHNLADYIDPEIFEKFEKFEEEEGMRMEAGVYDYKPPELTETMREIKALAKRIRDEKAIMKDEARITKNSTKPVVPRTSTAKARGRSVTRLRDQMENLGVDMDDTEDAHFTKTRGRSRSLSGPVRKRQRFESVASTSRNRSVSRAPRDEMGVKDVAMKTKLKKIAHKALKKKVAKKGLKGEADRFIGTKMPKHLFAGKRGVGKTDRR